MEKSSMNLKLLIDTKANRVMFAEADKDCVDFLFHLLSLPLATVIKLLKKRGTMGSLENLYDSIENLKENYIQSNQSKDALLKPVLAPTQCSTVPLCLLDNAPSSSEEKKFYRCSYCSYDVTVSDGPNSVCPNCLRKMTLVVPYVSPPSTVHEACNEGGFVKDLVTYTLKDDLVVEPMSSISCLTLLTKFNIKDLSSLEEKVVDLGMNEALDLLEASLQSEKVLSDVFLKGETTVEHDNIRFELD